MKLRLRHGAIGLVLGCAILILLTPVGPWLVAETGRHLAPGYGWRLDIDRVGGRLLGTAHLAGVRLASAGPGGATVRIPTLRLSPWSYTAAAESPDIQVAVPVRDSSQTTDSAPVPSPLPLGSLPDITVTDGRFRLAQPDGSELVAAGVDLAYRALADTGGVLELSTSSWTHTRSAGERRTVTGEITSRFILTPTQIAVEEFHLDCQVDSLSAEVDATGSVSVLAGWPLRATADIRLGNRDGGVGEFRIVAAGGLTPLRLDARLNASGSPADWGRAEVAANVALRADTITVADLVIDVIHGRIGGGGRFVGGSEELTLDLEAHQVGLERWTGSDMRGHLSGTGRLQGRLADRQYRADLDLGVSGIQLAGNEFDFDVAAALGTDNRISISVGSTLGELRAEGELDRQGDYRLTLKGTVRPEPLLGRPSAPVLIHGQVRPDEVDAQLSIERLPLAGPDFGPLQVDLAWRDPNLDARLALEGDLLAIQLNLDASAGRLDTLVTVVQPLAMQRILPDLRGTVSGQLGGNGNFSASEPRLSGRLEFSDTAYKGWHTGPLSLQLAHDRRRTELAVSGRGLSGRAYLDSLAAYGGDLKLQDCRLHYLDPAAEDTLVSLSLSGESEWTGSLEAPAEFEAAMNLEQFQLNARDLQVAALQPLDVRLTERSAQLQKAKFSTPAGPLTLEATMREDSLDAVADMPSIALAGLDGPWRGTGKAGLRVHGKPDQMRGTGFLQLAQAAFAEGELGDVAFQVDLDDSLSAEFRLDQPAHPGTELSAAFIAPPDAFMGVPTAPPESRFHLTTTAAQLDLTPLLAYAFADSVHGVLEASGEWRGSIRPGGKVSWEDVAGVLAFRQLELEKPGVRLALASGARVRSDHGATRLEDMVFAVEVDDGLSVREGGKITVDGVVHASDVNDLSLVVDKLDLAAIELLGVGALPRGTIDLDAGLTGSGEEPELGVTFYSELDDLGELDGSLRGDSSSIGLEVKWYTFIGDEVDLSASLPWDLSLWEFHLDQGALKSSSEGVNLLMFLDQLPQLEDIDGLVALDLELRGFDADAEIFGNVWTSDLFLRLIDVRPGYLFPAGEIEFAGTRGELKGLVGGPPGGKGTVEVSGYLELEPSGGIAYLLEVDGEDVPYNFDDVFDVPRIDVAVTMASTESGAKISGSVTLEGADIDLPLIDLNAPPVPPPPPSVQDPFLREMELDLQLDIRDLHVANEITNVEAEGSTRIYGTFYKPLFQGEVLINEGKVFVLNNEFDFQPGRIGLDRLVPSYSILEIAYDPLLLNPELDLGAVTTIKPIDAPDDEDPFEITFLLQGPARQVEPRFESEPPLADQQLLMLVAFGSTESMALFDQENRGALYSAAGQLLLSRQVKKIGLDEFQLLTSGTILETVGQPSMHIGKYVKWPLPLWLRYEGLTNDMSLGELRLEYKVRPYLTVTGSSQSEKERYGLGMGIEKDF